MLVAITAQEPTLESRVDQRFGRARYLIVVDTETGETNVCNNEVNLNAAQGAGIQTAQNIAQLKVEAVVTGHVGPNAFRALSAVGIKVYKASDNTVAEAIDGLNEGKLTSLDCADVEGHWE
jgi:predicted Fe-Mo cluster-binding NifX family protein